MTNTFVLALTNIANASKLIKNYKFVANDCVFKLTDKISVKISFTTGIMADRYDRLDISIMNRVSGPIDKEKFIIGDVIGYKKLFSNMSSPYISKSASKGTFEWYDYVPTVNDYKNLSIAVDNYLSIFTDAKKRSEKE